MAEGRSTACGHCGEKASKRCGGCKTMQYCTLECQQADWQFHKLLCKAYAEFADRTRPDVRRAILLPADGEKPRFIWVPVESQGEVVELQGQSDKITAFGDVYEGDWGVPERDTTAQTVLPAKQNPLGRIPADTFSMTLVCGKFRGGELLHHSISVMVRWDHQKHGPNRCLKRLAKQDVRPEHFSGPLLLLGMNRVKFPKSTVDLDASALTLALDAMIGLVGLGKVPKHAQKVSAVKVNRKSHFFELIDVPKRHPAFKSGTLSEIATMSGMPLQVWDYPATSEKGPSGAPVDAGMDTPPFDIDVLHLCLDTASPEFGLVPASVQADKRNKLIVRPTNEFDLGVFLENFLKLGQAIQDKFAPTLSKTQGGTPQERLRRLQAVLADIRDKVGETLLIRQKLMDLGLSAEEAGAGARKGMGLDS